MSKLTITPTTGRRVLLFIGSVSPEGAAVHDAAAPFDAGIAFVDGVGGSKIGESDQPSSCINCGYTDHNGVAQSAVNVPLYDRAQHEDDAHGKGETYAVWMEYQFNQALRAQQPKPARVNGGDIELVKLAENGRLTEAGQAKQGESE